MEWLYVNICENRKMCIKIQTRVIKGADVNYERVLSSTHALIVFSFLSFWIFLCKRHFLFEFYTLSLNMTEFKLNSSKQW